MKTYPTQERLRELFSYDEEKNALRYLVAPYRKPAMLGTLAGRVSKRDNLTYINVDRKAYVDTHLIAIHQTGKPPERIHHHKLTVEQLREALDYNPETGVFTWKARRRGVQVGKRADYVEHNGYRYVVLGGNRHLASRLAWFYVNGEWPTLVLRFRDGDQNNLAISNLAYGEWDQSDPVQKRAYNKANRKKNPMVYRRSELKRNFGITLEQYQAQFVAQGGVCAICEKPETDERSGKRKWLAVDHDHSDGSFRGLVCQNCNNGLGRFADDPERLVRAADYLNAHAAKPKTNVIPLTGRCIAGSLNRRHCND